jgi:predicted nucleic acid-binding protein
MQRPIVVLDACVLIPMPLCDTLLRAAESYLYKFFVSPEIIEETTRNLSKILIRRDKLDETMAREKAQYRIDEMLKAFPEVIIEPNYQLIDRLENHPKDRHILAAAIKVREEIEDDERILIVTDNLRDFPKNALEPYNVQAISPDDFLCFLLYEFDDNLFLVLQTQADERYQGDLINLLEKLEKGRLERLVKTIMSNYFLVDLSKEICTIIKKYGHKKSIQTKFLKGETYQILIEENICKVVHTSREIILSWNKTQILKNSILCEDYKKLQEFVSSSS